MILVFGGTTEGRKAVEVLEEAGKPYYYSTKTGEQDIALHHGRRTDGALDREAMLAFCREHGIRLLVDAAHPFARVLHETVAGVADVLHLPAIRYERIFPQRDPQLTWIDHYADLSAIARHPSPLATPHSRRENDQRPFTLLATTGVQSISQLKPLEAQGIKVYYRILNRPSSITLAHQQGAADEQLCFYEDGGAIDVEADAILLKESGLSGGFQEKVDAAKAHGMRIFVLKRPMTPDSFHCVNGPHGLRRMVEHLLPDFYDLHSGLTTGTCATAAAMAAVMQLRSQRAEAGGEAGALPTEVPVRLPDGETITVPVGYADGYAYCIKEAGDDPDVTNGIEIRATAAPAAQFTIAGGEGVGRFTLPGFDYPPGEPAINRGPRQMIEQNLQALLSPLSSHHSPLSSHHSPLRITISVPGGAEIARKTFNPRLGIEGGISIIGVSGIVKPFSEEAFIQSIRKCMEVAKASGSGRVVINSGAKSERFVKSHYPDLPQQAFVEYGNYIGETLRMAHELAFPAVTLGVMLGKAVKLAAGHLDTHSRRSTMDKAFVQQLLDEAHCQLSIADSQLTLARELWNKIPQEKTEDFCHVVISHCLQHCQPLVPQAALTLLLIDDDGTIHSL